MIGQLNRCRVSCGEVLHRGHRGEGQAVGYCRCLCARKNGDFPFLSWRKRHLLSLGRLISDGCEVR